jgi:hypothetical protein
MRSLRPLMLLVLFSNLLTAQSSPQDFALGMSARILDEECIRLVPDAPYVSGSAWYKTPIDLNKPFSMELCLVLGCKDDDGADGMVFIFHPRMLTGWRGEGMGFAGLRPALGIEFDTYRNYHLADPEEDHIAIMPNGRTHHAGSLLGPLKIPNLEDCKKHPLSITWDPGNQLLEIYLDQERQAAYTIDLVNSVFGGNSVVYWGVSAATGRLSNFHDICIKRLVYAEGNPVEQTEDNTGKGKE